MTVSMYDALEARIPMTAAERQMDAAQAALYPHLTKESGDRLWQRWQMLARPPQPVVSQPGDRTALFTWNGQSVAPADLRRNLSQSFGSRVQVA